MSGPVRWKRGYVDGARVGRRSRRIDGMVPTKIAHAFRFRQAEGVREGIGTFEALCHAEEAIDGRGPLCVEYDFDRRLWNPAGLARCSACSALLTGEGENDG